jgi:formylmethanofuran dehydrogenase subunit E-like metal-binding protein
MNTKKFGFLLFFLCSLLFFVGSVCAGNNALQAEAAKALKQAMAKLENPKDTQHMICLTNAGYALYQGEGTRILCKTVRDVCGVSADTGNILFVHTDLDAPLYFALTHKTGPTTLPMVLVSQEDETFKVSEPMDVYAKKGMSIKDFKAFGRPAFSVISIANGWARGFPDDLIQGALYHDHLCGGVSTGFLTVSYIKKHLPLAEGQRYTYVGAPAWCQDDYIATAMNLTPGKRGYLSMKYNWNEVWKTADQEYSSLGGLIIRYNRETQKGDANLLKFDWKRDELVKFINDPDFDMKQKSNPLLHVYYSQFYLAHKDHPEKFLSVIATKEINSEKDLLQLIGMGANPLEEMLGKRVVDAK